MLDRFFIERTQHLNCSELTKAYIINVMSNLKIADYSDRSLTIVYTEAQAEHRFETFQNLGDWLLFNKSVFPDSLRHASSDYYNALAQTAYYRCYRLLNRKWLLFEELADQFPNIVDALRLIFIELDAQRQASFRISPSLTVQI